MGITIDVINLQSDVSKYAWLGVTIPNTSYSETYKAGYDIAKADWLADPKNNYSLVGFAYLGSPDVNPLLYYQNAPKFLDINVTTSFITDVNLPAAQTDWLRPLAVGTPGYLPELVPLDPAAINVAVDAWKAVLGGINPDIHITFAIINTTSPDNAGRTYIGAGEHANDRVIFINDQMLANKDWRIQF